MKTIDLLGKTFGMLTVISRADVSAFGNAVWNCNCTCGATKSAQSNYLRGGRVVSCGCKRRARNKTGIKLRHGLAGTRTHNIWRDMLKRCKSHPRYAGRGIAVCARWHTFEHFYEDMGQAPSGFSIERENNDGNYEPGNCSWIPRGAQTRNTSKSRRLTYLGRTMILSDWAREMGVAPNKITDRLNKLGWSVERSLSTP